MNSSLFVFILAGFIILCTGIILSVVLLKAAWIRKEREALSSTDLRALEESAIVLIEQMKSEIDDRIVELDTKSAQLIELTRQADARITAFKRLTAASQNQPVFAEHDSSKLYSDAIPEAVDCVELAKSMELSAAEVKLMMRLADLGIDN